MRAMPPTARVRPETPADVPSVRAVHRAAFPSPLESRLVDALRAAGKATLSLVAEEDARVVGHVLFSPVSVEGTAARGVGLAPLAVLPGHQRGGHGSTLVREGLTRTAALGYDFVVLLGEPDYYRRFGFVPASRFGLRNEYGVDAPFMAYALRPGGLDRIAGLVRYAPEFGLATRSSDATA